MTNKFNVGDKVKVIANKYGSQNLVGDIGIVTEINGKSIAVKVKGRPDRCNWHNESELKTVESKPTKNQRITALEETVAKQGEEINELKLIVAQIRKPSTVVEEALANDIIEFEGKQYKKVDREAREGDVVIFRENTYYGLKNNRPYAVNTCTRTGMAAVEGSTRLYLPSYGRSKDNIDVYELIVEDKQEILPPAPKTQNELRAEIIEKAKGFVGIRTNGGEQLVPQKSGAAHWFIRNFEFVVNESKRTVVVLCKSFDGKRVYERGIAKCEPSDVFNEHVGKAIALGRALGLDVSEFEQAVQPTFAKGQIVRNEGQSNLKTITHEGLFTDSWYRDCGTWNYGSEMVIINDTNAQYGGVE